MDNPLTVRTNRVVVSEANCTGHIENIKVSYYTVKYIHIRNTLIDKMNCLSLGDKQPFEG